jgi:electron transfer flavoprotein alpha subunit
MNRTILVIAELRDGALRRVSLEAVGAARTLAGADGTVAAFVAGANPDAHAHRLLAAGADRVHTAERRSGEPYNAERALREATALYERLRPAAVVLGHTAAGKDWAPRLAALTDAGQVSDVIAIEKTEDGSFAFVRPIYAGKAFEKRVFDREPWIVTIRPNNFPVPDGAAASEVDADGRPDGKRETGAAGQAEGGPSESAIQPIGTGGVPDDADLRTVVREVVKRTSGEVDLAEARIVVSGGRGVKSAEGFRPLEELAAVLNGAVGASRGACDAGYCDYALQIGQTGKVVTPELYIACGISGAIQHLAGMSQSRVIVAINKDPDAPIFKVADYGIVGDLFEVVPLLTEQFKLALNRQ